MPLSGILRGQKQVHLYDRRMGIPWVGICVSHSDVNYLGRVTMAHLRCCPFVTECALTIPLKKTIILTMIISFYHLKNYH